MAFLGACAAGVELRLNGNLCVCRAWDISRFCAGEENSHPCHLAAPQVGFHLPYP